MPITGHCLVRNEDRFIWYAINSALPYLEKLIIYDTGSTDKTVGIVKSIKSSKIIFAQKFQKTPEELVKLRLDQIAQTRTEWFFLLDGDEIWPEKSIVKLFDTAINAPGDKLAVFCRTRNCVGDVYHYLPENTGRYELSGIKGHLNVRMFRKTPDLTVTGRYPLEAYCYKGLPINDQPGKLVFADVWYLHTTHLQRSSLTEKILNREKKSKYDLGLSMIKADLPPILFAKGQEVDVLKPRNLWYTIRAVLETPVRRLKNSL